MRDMAITTTEISADGAAGVVQGKHKALGAWNGRHCGQLLQKGEEETKPWDNWDFLR